MSTRHSLAFLTSLALAFASVTGCSQGGGANNNVTDAGSDAGGNSPAAIDAACTATANGYCAKFMACNANWIPQRYGSLSECQARQKASCVTSFNAAGTGNNLAHSMACANAYAGATCVDFLDGTIAECQAAAGTQANGQPCAYNSQCQSSFCNLVTGTNCGQCAAPLAPGADCTANNCSKGLSCIANGDGTSSCYTVQTTLAGTCSKTQPCGSGLGCVIPANATTGTCQPLGNAVGAACDLGSHTLARCDANLGLFCDGVSKTCQMAPLAQPGGMCGYGASYASEAFCTNSSTCFGATGMTQGTCQGLSADNGACDTKAGPACVPPARCVTGGGTATAGTCQLADPTMCM